MLIVGVIAVVWLFFCNFMVCIVDDILHEFKLGGSEGARGSY